ncbi:hypothetical protein DBR39_24255 [Chryseobacterium sp. KBW03]|nr:hypothetical protein DBR39_24255 [Chryseobacterium sp. KBW03]
MTVTGPGVRIPLSPQKGVFKVFKNNQKKVKSRKINDLRDFFVYGDSQNLQKRPKSLWHICGTFCILEKVPQNVV